ncbi:nucleoside deaminase [Rubrobacter marinus]|uniref:Nucleoside deaminase n=1 Tax=Rubrobacter marinus TaxID=2653852 RepID=A0A6G8PTY5_9ACTN|nr:nucleoside deaminase [Rubrobacter marinus]QIN77890.1 nucleoside deaminase [Rubrobacter marinus]
MRYPMTTLRLPEWVDGFLPDAETPYPSVEDRMRLVVGLARENVERGTGGPFGAAVFDLRSGRLVAPGVNAVVALGLSVAHAEVLAISTAQGVLGRFDLGGEGEPPLELVTSTEPCAMCSGAILWSGVRSLASGARDEDARAVGFDEGPKAHRWELPFEERGITVARDVLREEAAGVLRRYAEGGGEIYNARRGAP